MIVSRASCWAPCAGKCDCVQLRADAKGNAEVITFLWRLLTLWRCFFPSYLQEKRKHSLLLWSIKSSKTGMRGKAKWVAWRRSPGRRHPSLPPSLGHIFFWLWCVWVCVCVGCGLSFMRDPAADVTFLPAKATNECITHTYVRHTPILQETCVSFYDSPSVSH